MTVHDVEHLGFQRREWMVERIWWGLVVVLLVAAVLGVFSSGRFSETTAGGQQAGVEIKYERFLRYTGKATWTVRLQPESVAGRNATFFVSDDLARAMKIQHVTPQPVAEISTADGIIYRFAAAGSDAPPVVRVTFRPDALGTVKGAVGGGTGERVPLGLFVYP